MRFFTAASLAALCGTVAAHPADASPPAPTIAPRIQRRGDGSLVWITVDAHGSAETITPSSTVKDGSTIWDKEPPYSLTGSVYTTTNWASVYTNTQSPPNPRPTDGNGAGYMMKCTMSEEMKAANNPVCRPAYNATLSSDLHYFGKFAYLSVCNLYNANRPIVTWDPAYFSQNSTSKRDDKNMTSSLQPIVIAVRAKYLNSQNNTVEEAFTSPMRYNASSGFAVFDAKDLMSGTGNNGTGLNLTLVPYFDNNRDELTKFTLAPILVNVVTPLGRPQNQGGTPLPKGAGLYIGIPVAFGAVILLVCGGCWWNRKTRRIDLGNIVKRSRRGYSGRKERRRMFDATRPEDGGIQLHDNDNDFDAHDHGFSAPAYRDAPDQSSPVDGSFQQQGTTGGRNAFRDEVARQNEERRHDL